MEMKAPPDGLLTLCITLEDKSPHASVRVKGECGCGMACGMTCGIAEYYGMKNMQNDSKK